MPAVEDEEQNQEAAPEKSRAKTAGKAAPKSARPVRRLDPDEEDEEEERPRGKGKGTKKGKKAEASSNLFLLLGVGAGLLVLAGVVVVVLLIMNSPGDPKKPGPQADNKDGKKGGKGGNQGDKGSKPKDQKKDNADNGEPMEKVTLTAEQLAAECLADRKSAVKNYRNKEITLTGLVEQFPKDGRPNTFILVLQGKRDNTGFPRDVYCLLQAKEKVQVNELVWHQSVTIRGKWDRSYDFGSFAQLVDCQTGEDRQPSRSRRRLYNGRTGEGVFSQPSSFGPEIQRPGSGFHRGSVPNRQGAWHYLSVPSLPKSANQNQFRLLLFYQGQRRSSARELPVGQTVKVRGRFSGGANQLPTLREGHLVEILP